MSQGVKSIVIAGGGTAGWLTAAIIAAHHRSDNQNGLKVSLIESSDIPTIGVGEGTWPTLKNTLQDIGIKEADFFRCCNASFKQGGKFVDWVHGKGDFYYHPFTVPFGYGRLDLAPYLTELEDYAPESNFQHHVCEAGLAPRTLAESEFQGPANYAYHLDAGAFAVLLRDHCKKELGVEHIVDTISDTTLDDLGNIDSIVLEKGGQISGDLFIDCTGFASLLLGKKLNVPFKSVDKFLFNDTALAIQIPYPSDSDPIASNTIATAQPAGWIWDIGLTHRRGVGHVYSSKFISDEEAKQKLCDYLAVSPNETDTRKISFKSGYRAEHWKNNCVAVGLSAGFVEPLEATAIMLIEISARYIAENIPADKSVMPIVRKRFNSQMQYRWQRIIDFLKLHYVLTQRPEPYWQAHLDEATIPESLQEDLAIWKTRGPVIEDFSNSVELFPAASYQYVIYGMGFKPNFSLQSYLYRQDEQAKNIINRNKKITEQMLQSLPQHRQYIEQWLSL